MKTNHNSKQRASVAKRTLYYYWQSSKKYKWYAIGTVLSTPIVVLIRTTLIPLIFANMIDAISAGIPNDQVVPTLLPQGLALIGLYLGGSAILGWLRVYWCWKFELKVLYDLATICFDTVSSQSMQFHSDRFSGSLVSQTNKFIGSFERFFDLLIFDIIYLISLIAFIMIVLIPRAPWFALGLIVFIVLYISCSALTFKRISHLSKERAEAENKQTGQLADSVSNILSVKSYGRESHERHRYANFNRASYNAGLAEMRATMTRDLSFNFVNIGIIAILVVFMIVGVPAFGLSISTLILIVNYSMTIMGELWNINHIFKHINRTFGDAYEMTNILDAEDTVKDAPEAKELVAKKGDILFDNITFQHADAKTPIFKDFSLRIKPGERVGLVGVSGSGKTTLTKLLLRFADVQDGEILVDGQNISKVQQVSLREAIAYVPQETALFHRSIADNIAYARPDATREEIIRAAKLANAHEFVKDLPNGYDTLVGERGIKLSGGQRQRVAIARAILKDAPILVLDEATSALDSESEALIQDALVKLMKGRTSIVVAHRLSTIASLDRIVVLENGKIIEQGTHHQLLEKGGEYHHLWSRQSGAFLDSED
ncbi:MAG: ABC transporter ATP-binding protein/permease [Candidatus Saccharibacteria bacterium]|nr:ABC transporter ATP-binding protein/permease [Candidatus Saccharibacteria bacterium]